MENEESLLIVDAMMAEIERRHGELSEQWPAQRQALQVAGKFRQFEQDCAVVRSQLDGWLEDMRQVLPRLARQSCRRTRT